MSNPTNIYIGPWKELGKGVYNGWTLTLSSRNGGYLTSFLSVFVTVVGSFFWQLVVFLVHQARASRVKPDKKQNGIWHTNMVMLRNSASPISLAWETLRAWRSWRKSASDTLGSLLLLIISLVIAAAVGAAGVLTARVRITERPHGLLKSSSCGPWSFSDPASSTQKNFNDTVTAANYAGVCYYGSLDPNVCSTQYVQPTLNWTTTSNVSCPFNASLCSAPPYRMDTGLLDTRSALGLNILDQDRLFYRRISTCSPLHTAGYERPSNVTVDGGQRIDSYDFWYFGPINGTDFTWRYNMDAMYDQSGYELTSVYYNPGISTNFWQPIPELNQSAADISLFFLAQGFMRYSEPCNDPFFLANSTVADGSGDSESFDYATVMGCTDQHEICLDSDGKSCSQALGSVQLIDWIDHPSLTMTSAQTAIAAQLSSILALSTLQQSVLGRGYNALRAASTSIYQLGTWEQYGSLPEDQWTIEVNSWFAVQMANLQRSMVAWVSGTSTPYSGGNRIVPEGIAATILCHQQMVPLPSGYQNFQFASVLLIIILGVFIIILALVLPTVIVNNKKKKKSESYGWLAWTLDETLQLHRMAQEQSGWGGRWLNELDSVPVTKKVPAEAGNGAEQRLGRYKVVFEHGRDPQHRGFIETGPVPPAGVAQELEVDRDTADEAGTGSNIHLVPCKAPSPSQRSVTASM